MWLWEICKCTRRFLIFEQKCTESDFKNIKQEEHNVTKSQSPFLFCLMSYQVGYNLFKEHVT